MAGRLLAAAEAVRPGVRVPVEDGEPDVQAVSAAAASPAVTAVPSRQLGLVILIVASTPISNPAEGGHRYPNVLQ